MSWAELYILALTISVMGVAWIRYIAAPDGLLEILPIWLDNALTWMRLPYKAIDKITWVTVQCEKCFSGQLAFWIYIYLVWSGLTYSLIAHAAIVCAAIVGAAILNAILNRLE